MKRHGEMPTVINCTDRQEQLSKIKEQSTTFLQGDNVSVGIILQTNSAAKELFELLSTEFDIQLISPDSTPFLSGQKDATSSYFYNT